MKTRILLTIALLVCIATLSSAQIIKNALMLGGAANFYSTSNPQTQYNVYQFKSAYTNVQIGKVVKENTAVGLILSYTYSNQHPKNFPDSSFSKYNEYRVGLFYRKYKKLLKELYFFGEVDASYIYSQNSQGTLQDGSDMSKIISNGGAISFVPGISYGICKRLQLELLMPSIISLTYQSSKINYNAPIPSNINTKGNNFSFNANLNSNFLSNFGIGFKFLLGKKG